MKKLLSILLILMMVFCFAACGGDEPAADEGGQDSQQQEQQPADTGEQQDEPEQQPQDADEPEQQEAPEQQQPQDAEEPEQADEDIPTEGKPLDWPENDYTALVPVPDEGGKVLAADEIGTLFAVDLDWEMEKGIAYAQKLQDAGFGEDCVEKYEQYGYIDRTANGVNVQLLDMFGKTSISIMPAEE